MKMNLNRLPGNENDIPGYRQFFKSSLSLSLVAIKLSKTIGLLCLLIMLLSIAASLNAQTITAKESRCVNTGKITLSGTIGAGGPYQDSIISAPAQYINTGLHYVVNMPDSFTALFPGTYTLQVIDQHGTHFTYPNIVVGGNYVLPGSNDYQPAATPVTNCSVPNGSLQGTMSNGRAPYLYTIVSGPAQAGTSNATGTFINLPAGSYAVQASDSCQNIQTRNITIINNSGSFSISNPVINQTGCANFTLNALTVSPSLPAGVHYQVVDYDRNGGTRLITNGTSLPLAFSLYHADDIQGGWVQIIVTDACGNSQQIQPSAVANDWGFDGSWVSQSCTGGVVLNTITTSGTITAPYTTAIQPYYIDASGNIVNITPPQTVASYPYTLTGVSSTTNPLFTVTTITDACGVTKKAHNNLSFTITPGNLTFNNDCSTATLSAVPNGVYTSPVTYYAYTGDYSSTIGSNTTGTFTLPNGIYAFGAVDACGKSTSTGAIDLNHAWKLSINEPSKGCDTGALYQSVSVPGRSIGVVTYAQYEGAPPITASSVIVSTQTYTGPNNGLPSNAINDAAGWMYFVTYPGHTYTYVAKDACGKSDTVTYDIPAGPGHQLTLHTSTVKNKCINKGDIFVAFTKDGGPLVVVVKDINQPDPSISTNLFYEMSNTNQLVAANLPLGTYIVMYYDQYCGAAYALYDTVHVTPYLQPTVSTVQSFTPCSGGGTPVIVNGSGGVPPFTYEVLGSTPDNYTSPQQTSSMFTLPTSQNTVTVRILDACLNSGTKTVAITKAGSPIIRPDNVTLTSCSLPLNFSLFIDSLYSGSVFSWTKLTGTGAGNTVLGTSPSLPLTYSSIADTATYQVNVTVPNTCYNVTSGFDVSHVTTTCLPVISGNVFDDANGLTDNTVNGTGTNAGGVNVILVNASGNVVATTPVASNGAYNFINITNGVYSIILSTTAGTAGSTAPNPSLPSGWVNAGENNGAGAGSDGSANGILTNISVSTTSITNLDFGIDQIPAANDITASTQVNPGGTSQVTVPTLNGKDLEDGTYDGISGINTVVINTLPANGILYYNGTAVTAGQYIPNYNPSLLKVDPDNGALTVTFTYSETDAAGISGTPATVAMPFNLLSILAVKLISFTATASGTNARLDWQTAAGTNASKFIIEHSTDNAITFAPIGQVKAQNENNTELSYIWFQVSPSLGEHFYRLRMLDDYGNYNYSNVKSVTFSDDYSTGIKIYPVPASSVAKLELPKPATADMVIQLYDNSGTLINTIFPNMRQIIPINVQSLPTGIYTVKLIRNRISVYTGRVIKL